MPARSDIDNRQFKRLFVNDIPLIDVRAPVEFSAGAFPCATNLPLLDDEQRHIIGCVYAEDGQDAAIERGLQLATDDIRAQRLQAWKTQVEQNPEGYLYCFRGGLRSKTTQQWLQQAGCDYPLIRGGYKAMRRYLLDELDSLSGSDGDGIILLAGATASGKTELIQRWSQSIDLEGLANHRGSAFGATFSPQPAQIDFENNLVIDWLKCQQRSKMPVVMEAESHLIGRLTIPPVLRNAMQQAPVIELRCTREQRLLRLRHDYIEFALQQLQGQEDDPWRALEQYVFDALSRIKKRLGGDKFAALTELLPTAVQQRRDSNSWQGFDSIFEQLLDHYYDKMYDYQLEKQSDQVVFRGTESEVLEWLADRDNKQLSSAGSNAI